MAKKSTKKKNPKRASKKPAKKKQDSCFVIMPFGGWFDTYFERIYRPAITDAKLIPKRADDLYRPSTIVNDIWEYTQNASVILADLTGKNANVFYELGLAHAVAKPAVLVAESMDDVPFDLRALRVLEYNKNTPNWGEILQQDITTALIEILESPLQAVLPAFLNVRPSQTATVTEKEKEFLELRREVDLLNREVRTTYSSPVVVPITELLDRLGLDFTDYHEAELSSDRESLRIVLVKKPTAAQKTRLTKISQQLGIELELSHE